MWISKVEIAKYDARIKELENIICPAEQHDFVQLSEERTLFNGYGTEYVYRSFICKKCLKKRNTADLE